MTDLAEAEDVRWTAVEMYRLKGWQIPVPKKRDEFSLSLFWGSGDYDWSIIFNHRKRYMKRVCYPAYQVQEWLLASFE